MSHFLADEDWQRALILDRGCPVVYVFDFEYVIIVCAVMTTVEAANELVRNGLSYSDWSGRGTFSMEFTRCDFAVRSLDCIGKLL